MVRQEEFHDTFSCFMSEGRIGLDDHSGLHGPGAGRNWVRSSVDLDKTHSQFVGNAITFLSEIRAEDFNAPRALWEKVWDDGAKERFIGNVSGHMANCTDKEIIKRQIGIFREVSEDLAGRLEKATGIKGYPGIGGLRFNGTHNGMATREDVSVANGMAGKVGSGDNGAPVKGTHKEAVKK